MTNETKFELYQADGSGEFYGTRSGDWFPIEDSEFNDMGEAVVAASELATLWNSPVAVFIYGTRYPETIVTPDVIR